MLGDDQRGNVALSEEAQRELAFYQKPTDPAFRDGLVLTDFQFRQWLNEGEGRVPQGYPRKGISLQRGFPRMGKLQRDYRDFLKHRGIDFFTLEEREEEDARQRAATGEQVGNNPGNAVPGTGTAGQVLSSEILASSIETALADYGAMMKTNMQVITTPTGEPLRIPTVDDTSMRAEIIGQAADASEDGSYASVANMGAVSFYDVELGALKYSTGVIKVPSELIRDSHYPVVSYIGARLGERLGRAWSEDYTLGKGWSVRNTANSAIKNAEPWGVVPAIRGAASGSGVDEVWTQDAHNKIITGTTHTASLAASSDSGEDKISYYDFVDVYTSLDPAYRARGEWMFNSTVLGILMKLSTGTTGYPLWMPGNIAGRIPPTVFGHPYVENTHMAEAVTSSDSGAAATQSVNDVIAVFGDFSTYMARNVDGLQLRVLNELYAESDQIGIIGFASTDANYLWREEDAKTGGRKNAPMKYMARKNKA